MAKAKAPLTPEQAEVKAMKKEKNSQGFIKFVAVLLALVLVDHDLLALDLSDDLALNSRTGDSGVADLDLTIVLDHQNVEGNGGTVFLVHLVDVNGLTLRHAVLLVAGADDSVHAKAPPIITRQDLRLCRCALTDLF